MHSIDLTKVGFGTAAIHAGQEPDPVYGALATPIFQTSTYCFETVEEGAAKFRKEIPGFVYSRSGNPTNAALEQKIASLEGGGACVVTSSGMGAIGSVLVAFLKAGDHIIAGNCVYGCTSFVMHDTLRKFGVDVTFADTSDLGAVEAAIRPETKMIYFETPTNPTMVITDIEAVSKLAHRHAVRVVVDNTFAPPPIQFPLKLGADIVLHSVTKYLNGHGDLLGGAVVGTAEDITLIRTSAATKLCGSTASPFNSFLVLRGMQTLELRMARHCENGMALAKWLEAHPYVESVRYPGLDSFPQRALAERQMNGLYGGIISLELKDGVKGLDSFTACTKMLNALKIVSIAVSLGDPETLIEHPASMTHGIMPKEDRVAAGISDGLIRLSAGLENAEDLIKDFEQAFGAI